MPLSRTEDREGVSPCAARLRGCLTAAVAVDGLHSVTPGAKDRAKTERTSTLRAQEPTQGTGADCQPVRLEEVPASAKLPRRQVSGSGHPLAAVVRGLASIGL